MTETFSGMNTGDTLRVSDIYSDGDIKFNMYDESGSVEMWFDMSTIRRLRNHLTIQLGDD